MHAKLGDWVMFTKSVHTAALGVQGCDWPPTREGWLLFLTEARPLVSSCTRFCCVVGNVCQVGMQYLSVKLKVPMKQVDPRGVV